MGDSLDDFVDKLQGEIFDDAKEAFGEEGFDRWRNPKFNGTLEGADASARLTGSCGDSIEIFLKFEGDRVAEASYLTDGCASSMLCGSFAAELAVGKSPDELADITGEAVLKRIGRFPKDDEHCAFLASATLQEALGKYLVRQIKESEDGKQV